MEIYAADSDEQNEQATDAPAIQNGKAIEPQRENDLSRVDDYLGGTEVYQTEDQGEFEIESTVFLGKMFQSYGGEIEYGVTDQLMIDAEVDYSNLKGTGDADDGGQTGLSAWNGELELRYRLARQRSWPIDVAIALGTGAQFVHSQATQWSAEPRLILQRSFDRFTITGNVGGELGRLPSLETSFGARCELCKWTTIGCELLYDYRERQLAGIPQIYIYPFQLVTVVLGYSFTNSQSPGNTWDMSVRIDF
jgi:hypothetical protein